MSIIILALILALAFIASLQTGFYLSIATVVAPTAKRNTYGWISQWSCFREWAGKLTLSGMGAMLPLRKRFYANQNRPTRKNNTQQEKKHGWLSGQ